MATVAHSPAPYLVGKPKSAADSNGKKTPGPLTYDAKRPTTAERLTPMPSYMWPVAYSDPRHFKKLQEEFMMSKLVDKRSAKKDRNAKTRDEARHLAKQIPIDVLARDWLNKQSATVETRVFLVDRIMPVLILGLEKLLQQVQRLDLVKTLEPVPNFNPINILAQYLMRNNPRYTNLNESSPYVRGLRAVSEELKQELFDLEENRLVRIKAEAKRKREVREEKEKAEETERFRREEALQEQFLEWSPVGPDGKPPLDPKLELAVLQNAIKSFEELTDEFPEPLRSLSKISGNFGPLDESGQTVNKASFLTLLSEQTGEWPNDLFDHLVRHLSSCATSHRSSVQQAQRQATLEEVFNTCDKAAIGQLDRHRVLNLFEMFYDKAVPEIKEQLTNPRGWPVIDYSEVTDDASVLDLEDLSPVTSAVSAHRAKAEGVEQEDEEQEQDEEEELQIQEDQVAPGQVDVTEQAELIVAPEGENQVTVDEAKNNEIQDSGSGTAVPAVSESNVATEKVPTAEGDPTAAGDVPEKKTSTDELEADIQTAIDNVTSKPPLTQQSKVSFKDGTAFDRERSLLTSHGTRPQSRVSAFDENTLNLNQFVQVVESFLGDACTDDIFVPFVRYFRDGYVETEEERMTRLLKAKEEQNSTKRKSLLNSIFDMWDNEGSGYLDLEDILVVMKKYKDGIENEAIDAALFPNYEQAKVVYKSRSRHYDNRLSKREFRDFVYSVVGGMSSDDEFEYFIEFLLHNVERSYQERVRGEARKKWLQQIVLAGETGGAQMEPVYKTVFAALYKDVEAHGQGKVISAYIAMLERNTIAPERGDSLLRYVAATIDHAEKVLNKALFKDMKNVSFSVVESGKPVHIPRVLTHGGVHFWDPNINKKDTERGGALILIPLKDQNKRVFGIMGLDTLNDPQPRSIFITHEIQYYQGVAKSFSIAYHHTDGRQKLMRISESAISWIQRRSPNVREIVIYMVEPNGKGTDYVLRRMMNTDNKGTAVMKKNPDRLERKDNLFRDYLFKCVDNSESVSADAYGERHLSIPLRDDEGKAIVVMDICIGDKIKVLPRMENHEVMKMVKLLQMAYKEINKELKEGEKTIVLEGETGPDENRADILFDRLMLAELRENISQMDAQGWGELKSYKEPPTVVHLILQALFAIIMPSNADSSEFHNWEKIKKYIQPNLTNRILDFDPTSGMGDYVSVDTIHQFLDAVPHGLVSKHGSTPAQHLYNWVFVCISLIEHTRKMRASSYKPSDDDYDDGKSWDDDDDYNYLFDSGDESRISDITVISVPPGTQDKGKITEEDENEEGTVARFRTITDHEDDSDTEYTEPGIDQ